VIGQFLQLQWLPSRYCKIDFRERSFESARFRCGDTTTAI